MAKIAALFWTAFLAFGLFQIATLPPWEGFDEFAHYSSIQQIADTGTLPRYGEAQLSTIVTETRAILPFPYIFAEESDSVVGANYRAFFASPLLERWAAAETLIHERPTLPRRFAPGSSGNWQAQHPPLYYLLLAPAMRATAHWSLGAQLFLLRSISYALAAAGLAIAALALARHFAASGEPTRGRWVWVAFPLWPYLAPEWFATMGRLGNDSLCALLLGLLVWPLLRIGRGVAPRWRDYVVVGLLLGLGIWTKGFFVPLGAGIGLYLLCVGSGQIRARFALALLAGLVALAIGGWRLWEVYQATGSFVGGGDYARYESAGGLAAQIGDFSIASFLQHLVNLGATFLWVGTWSMVVPMPIAYVPLIAQALGHAFSAARRAFARADRAPALLAILVPAPFMAGLLWNAFIQATTDRPWGSIGWYFHIAAPVLSIAICMTLARALSTGFWRPVAILGLTYGLGFWSAMSFMQLKLFTGCLGKHRDLPLFKMTDDGACLVDLGQLVERLAILAYPTMGAVAGAVGLLAAIGGLALLWRAGRSVAVAP